MATTVIQNQCVAGALAGIMQSRPLLSFTPTDYANAANVARAIADECIIKNALLTAPMADADNAQIGAVCFASVFTVIAGCFPTSVTAADYAAIANQAMACAKQAASKLI